MCSDGLTGRSGPATQMDQRLRLATNEVGGKNGVLKKLELSPKASENLVSDQWAARRRFTVINGGKYDRRR